MRGIAAAALAPFVRGARRLAQPLQPVTSAWNTFFHLPQPVIGMALFRVLWGLVLLLNWALLAPDILPWFSEHGVLSSEAVLRMAGPGRLNLLSVLPRDDAWVIVLFSATVLASVTLTLGLATRLSALIVFLGMTSLHHRNPLILNSADSLLRVVTFLLVFSPAGEALSLDRWRRGRRRPEGDAWPRRSPWVQRLIQIQIAVVYFSTFLWKLEGSMWRDGTAVYFMSRLVEFHRFPVPLAFEHLWVIKALTWFSLFQEFALGVLIWFPLLRYPVLIGGLLMHLGVEYTMNIPVFQWLMIVSLSIFIDPAHLEAAVGRLRSRLRRSDRRVHIGTN